MFCKFCGTELADDVKVCPECGKTLSGNGWKIAVIAVSALILVGVLVVAVLFGTGVLGGEEEKAQSEPTEETQPSSNLPSYTVDDAVAAEMANEVVAQVGNQVLTNSELQLHYWSSVYNFLNQYGYYLSAFGLDLSLGLDQQTCYLDNTKTWEEYFLEQALDSWKGYAVLCEMAEAEGFVLDEKSQDYVDKLPETIEAEALSYGFSSVEEMLSAEAGPGCTVDGLIAYRKIMYISMQYFSVKYEGMTPTEDEVNAYFEEHAAELEESGVTKDSGKIGDVRHILIKVEGGTTDENGNTVYTEEEWAACLAEAERIYQLWKDGDATEDSFVALVAENTDDPGSAETGGLYEDVSIGSGYVEPFEKWAADASRQVGDTELVKVEASNYAGYHFMYYVGGEDVWYATCSKKLLDARFAEFMNAGLEKHIMERFDDKIALGYQSLTG